MHIENIKNGNGIGDPGPGTHAVLSWLIIYPLLHSIKLGTHPSPAVFTVKPVGQIKPTNTHYPVELFASYFKGQYYTHVALYNK
jgi:hypothetical protein